MRVLRPRAAARSAARWVVTVLAWLLVMAGGSATAAVAATQGPGSSGPVMPSARSARVGALFDDSSMSYHYCSASVVHSPGGDLIVTAAHCLSTDPGTTVFVPGYRDGTAPYGEWKVVDVVEDTRWTADDDTDLDVAFAVVAPLHGRTLEQVVGANRLETDPDVGDGASVAVTLTGYPQDKDAPITCSNTASRFADTQLRVVCADFTDGTSGSPWVVAATGKAADSVGRQGDAVVGVIGGFEQGGYTAGISYSSYFDQDTLALYQQAVRSAARLGRSGSGRL